MGASAASTTTVTRGRAGRAGRRAGSSRPRPSRATTRRSGLRRALLFAGSALLALFLLAVLERIVYAGDVMPGVHVEGVDIAGKSEREAYADVSALAAELETDPLRVTVDGQEFVADPSLLGVEVDEYTTLRAARQAARSGNPVEQTLGAVLRRLRDDEVDLRIGYSATGVEGLLDGWQSATLDGAVEGDLRFEGTEVVPVLPRAGVGILRDEARRLIDAELRSAARDPVPLPVGEVEPSISAAEVERTAADARELLAGPIEIVADGATTVTVSPEQLVSALGTERRDDQLELRIDAALLRTALGASLAAIETPPVDAGFEVTGAGAVQVVPSVAGRQLDLDAVAAAILDGERRITASLVDVEPERDTAWAQSLGIKEQVSAFTTNHRSGEERVKNIHRGADLLNNYIVEPGEVFSLNEAIGPRTPDRGFVKAPVFYGEFTEDFGGGVSQLATTTFNAVFFGGYEDVYHKPHTIYITRYPMGREATVNYPTVDLQFRNNTAAGVLIRTSYTSSSITVAFYGDKEGKTVTEVDRKVLATRPVEDRYFDCPGPAGLDKENVCASLPDREVERIEEGHEGIDVEFYRLIEQPGKEPVRERFFWRYRMTPNQYLVGTLPAATTTVPAPTTVAPTTAAPAAPTTAPPAAP